MIPSVLKFGGAACRDTEHIQRVAELIEGPCVVVVSAMAGVTDELIDLAHAMHKRPPARELDMLLSCGERISMSLLAMALEKRGIEAVSLTGSQSGIITSNDHTMARIIDVRCHRASAALAEGKVVIIGGFQGVSESKEITTFGRGGSDTTAVALGIALGAERVTFYKDVPGFFDKDPKVAKEAKRFEHLSFEKAYELAIEGAKVLDPRSIALAQLNGLELFVRGMAGTAGTRIGSGPRTSERRFEQKEGCAMVVQNG